MRRPEAYRGAQAIAAAGAKSPFGRVLLLLFLVLAGAGAFAVPQQTFAQGQSTGTTQAPMDAGRRATPQGAVPEKNQEVRDENDEYRHSAVVVKLGSVLGMGPEAAATVFTVFNFLVLVAGVGFVLLKVLPKALRDRSTRIQKRLVEARTATEEANARLSAVESRLAKLDGQIADMRAEAEVASAREAQRQRESVEEEKGKIVAAAEAEIQAATALARRQIQQHAAELAIEHAARKLRITAETDRALIGNFARQLSGEKGGQN